MALTFKSLGKAFANAPKKAVKGVKSLVTHPGKAITNIGHSLGDAWEMIDDPALTILGGAIGGPGGAALGAGLAKAVGNGKPQWGKVLKNAAIAGTGAYGLSKLGGVSGALGKLGRVAGSVGRGALGVGKKVGGVLGHTLENATMSDGGLDLGKLGALFGAGSSIVGNRRDNAQAQAFNDSNAKLRQMLMERILEKPNYNFR